ncbi:hypothetical protein Golob_003803, partial [Gossypium lobatum]|nr:hypothetical protein [Gossypium lobatum]
QKSKAFKEIGEYAFGFITSTVILHGSSAGLTSLFEKELVRFSGQHMQQKTHGFVLLFMGEMSYLGLDFHLFDAEVVISGGMSVPRMLTTLDACVN